MTRQYENYGRDQFNIENVQGNLTFNETQIIQISVAEVKTRPLIKISPYKGLKRFEAQDKDLFFGRDQLLQNLVTEIEKTNLVLLLGASGSGKSSVVRAGLIPYLFRRYGSDLYEVTFTPDQDPFESLYGSLLQRYKQSEVAFVRQGEPNTLTQLAKQMQKKPYWFICIDQFEELFTTTPSDRRDRFIKALLHLNQSLLKGQAQTIKVIAVMRADFMDRLSPYPRVVKAIEKHWQFVTEMYTDELRLAIEQPAAQHGVVFEDGLADEIIKDVQGQAGYLPLLQYTLNLLWELEVANGCIEDRTLTTKSYRNLGGVRGALQKHVNAFYEKLPSPEQQAVQQVFLKLVEISRDEDVGTEWKPVRRRALLSDFGEVERMVLPQLIDQNLLVSNSLSTLHQPIPSLDVTIEISHEVLLTSWPSLSDWITANRQSIVVRNRLYEDVARWETTKANDDLWRGAKLEQVLKLKDDLTFNEVLGGFKPAAKDFIRASQNIQKWRRLRAVGVLATTLVLLLGLIKACQELKFQTTQVEKNEINKQIQVSVASSKELFALNQETDAIITAIKAANQLKQFESEVDSKTWIQSFTTLQEIVYDGFKAHKQLPKLSNSATSVAFSSDNKILGPDNKILAIAVGNTIQIYNRNGSLLNTLKGHTNLVTSVAFSPSGNLIASASKDKTVKIWTVEGKLLQTLKGHKDSVYRVVFAPDGNSLASAGYDRTVKIWHHEGTLLKTLKGGRYGFISLSFSPDSKTIIAAGAGASGSSLKTIDGEVKIWHYDGQLLQNLNRPGWDVKFSPDGKLFALASGDIIQLRNLNGTLLKTFLGHADRVTSVSFSPDGNTIASASYDKTIKLWSINGELLQTLKGHGNSVYSVSFNPDGNTIASASADKTARLWLKNTNESKKVLEGYGGLSPSSNNSTTINSTRILKQNSSNGSLSVNSVGFSADGKIIASASGNVVQLWTREGNLLKILPAYETDPNFGAATIWSVSLSPDNKTIAWATHSGTQIRKLDGTLLNVIGKSSDVVSFSPNGQIIAVAGRSGVQLWRPNGSLIRTLPRGGSNVSFSPNGQIIAVAANNTIQLWNQNGKLLHELKGHTDDVTNVNFSPNSQVLASASSDKTVKIWNYDGRLFKTLKGHLNSVNAVSFSPNGKILASASSDGTIKLWDLNGSLIETLEGHSSFVWDLRFSPDGKTLASGSDDNTVILWNLNLDNLITHACAQLHDYIADNPSILQRERSLCEY